MYHQMQCCFQQKNDDEISSKIYCESCLRERIEDLSKYKNIKIEKLDKEYNPIHCLNCKIPNENYFITWCYYN